MSYEKHIWETGEVITAEKLNNIENGIVSGDTDYLRLDWYYGDTYDEEGIEGQGTFCGYKYYITASLRSDIETGGGWIRVGEIRPDPEDPNRFSNELLNVVRLLVLNRLWGLFGEHISGESVDYVGWKFQISNSTYNALKEFDWSFTISL